MSFIIILLQLVWIDIANEPRQMWPIGDGRILLHDYAGRENIVRLLDLASTSTIGRVGVGRGPGEIMQGSKSVSVFSNGDLLLWDHSLRRALIFSSELEYKSQLSIPDEIGSVSDLALVGDRRIAVFALDDAFLRLYELSSNRQISNTEPKLTIPLVGDLNAYRNLTIRQRIFHRNYGDKLVLSFEYSTDLLIIDEQGRWSTISRPQRVPPPRFNTQEPNSLPYVHEHPKCSVSLAVGSNRIYNLVRAETMSRSRQLLYFNDLEGLDEELMTGYRIDVYDLASKRFIKSVNLSSGYKVIVLIGARLYGIRSLNGVNSLEVIAI